MFSASPLYEHALLVAQQIQHALTPQPYCFPSDEALELGSLADPTHVYVGTVQKGSSFCQMDLILPGFAPINIIYSSGSQNLTNTSFTYFRGSTPFFFVGYRIPLNP
jgi:hypothetical protein